MSCLGSHFALTSDQAEEFTRDWPTNFVEARTRLGLLETQYDALDSQGWVQGTEHAWEAIHRSLTDGKYELGTTPQHLCILGATERFWLRRESGSLEYIVNVLEPSEVRLVADAIKGIDQAALLRGYEGIDPDSFYASYAPEGDFEYTWQNFRLLKAFFERAADAGRWVVFRVDQ